MKNLFVYASLPVFLGLASCAVYPPVATDKIDVMSLREKCDLWRKSYLYKNSKEIDSYINGLGLNCNPNHITCTEFGFVRGTESYGNCRIQQQNIQLKREELSVQRRAAEAAERSAEAAEKNADTAERSLNQPVKVKLCSYSTFGCY